MSILNNPADYFLLGSGITAILFVVFLVYKKEKLQKKEEYIKFLESENFVNKSNLEKFKYKISELELEKKT